MKVIVRTSLVFIALFATTACDWLDQGIHGSLPDAAGRYPEIIAVELQPTGGGVYDVAVTISSPYDTPERYADGWRVLDPEGNVLGTHTLLHDHAGEQPFTRTQRGLAIPEGVTQVTVEGRDQANGFGGATATVDVPA